MGCINSFDTAHDYLSESLFKLCFQSPDRIISDKLASAEYPLFFRVVRPALILVTQSKIKFPLFKIVKHRKSRFALILI